MPPSQTLAQLLSMHESDIAQKIVKQIRKLLELGKPHALLSRALRLVREVSLTPKAAEQSRASIAGIQRDHPKAAAEDVALAGHLIPRMPRKRTIWRSGLLSCGCVSGRISSVTKCRKINAVGLALGLCPLGCSAMCMPKHIVLRCVARFAEEAIRCHGNQRLAGHCGQTEAAEILATCTFDPRVNQASGHLFINVSCVML